MAGIFDLFNMIMEVVYNPGIMLNTALQVVQPKVNLLLVRPEMSAQQLPREEIPTIAI